MLFAVYPKIWNLPRGLVQLAVLVAFLLLNLIRVSIYLISRKWDSDNKKEYLYNRALKETVNKILKIPVFWNFVAQIKILVVI